MLVIGVCGPSSTDISSRLERHVTGADFLSSKAASDSIEIAMLSIVHHHSLAQVGDDETEMLLVVVDPPAKQDPKYTPLRKFLAARPKSQIVPFYLHDPPPDRSCLTGQSTFSDFKDKMLELTGEVLDVSEETKDDPLLDAATTRTILQWENTELEYRYKLDDQQKRELNLGTGMVICFTAVKGGSGKSSLALIASNLMTNWAADRSETVLLMDCNLGQPVIASLTWEEPRKDIRWAITQIEEGADPDEALDAVANPLASGARTDLKLEGGGKIHAVVSTLKHAGRVIQLRPEAMYELVAAAARKYDYVLVDTPPIDPVATEVLAERFVLPVADEIIFVCENEFGSSRNALIYHDALTEHHQGLGDHIGLVLNKEEEHHEFDIHQLEHMCGQHGLISGSPPRVLGSVPYSGKLKRMFNEGANLVPEVPEVDVAVASILEKVLGENEGSVLPDVGNTSKKGRARRPQKTKRAKKSGGFFRRSNDS